MPRADRSIPFLTGLIIAALYVILLVGFSRESYMRRDALARLTAAAGWPTAENVSKRGCRIGRSASAASTPEAAERQNCLAPAGAAQGPASEFVAPLTFDALRRAMRDNP
jgi:hypothetical protein